MRAHSAVHQNSGSLPRIFLTALARSLSTTSPVRAMEVWAEPILLDEMRRKQPCGGLGPFYLEPKKTVHLVFPKALRLKQAVTWRIGFAEEGPGTITIDINAVLVSENT